MIAILTTAAGELVGEVEIDAPPPEAVTVAGRVFVRALDSGAFGRVPYREAETVELQL